MWNQEQGLPVITPAVSMLLISNKSMWTENDLSANFHDSWVSQHAENPLSSPETVLVVKFHGLLQSLFYWNYVWWKVIHMQFNIH